MASEKFSGSCICGSVKYEISGRFRYFFHCHCGRCRKATGTGHASNVILDLESAQWTEGKELLENYRVPDAERYRTVFCKSCGSPLPRVAPDRDLAVIPAGSLDSHPELEPSAHIFCDSKVPWSCEAAGLPAWAEYPQKP